MSRTPRSPLRLLVVCLVAGCSSVEGPEVTPPGWFESTLTTAVHTVELKSPGPEMHFTQGQPLVFFIDAIDTLNWANPITCPNGAKPSYPQGGGQATCPGGAAPEGWPKTQILIDGVPQKDTVTNSTTVQGSTVFSSQGNPTPVNFYRFHVVGVAPGPHQVVARALFAPAPYSDGAILDDAPVTVVVDLPPMGKATITLNGDVSGTVNWSDAIVVGNGFTVRPSGSLVIRNSLITGVAGIQGSVSDAAIEGTIFEDVGRVDLTLGGGPVKIASNEFRANNRLTFVAHDPDVPVILNLVGNSGNTKLFQGNRVGAGITRFGGQQWLIGGDTDAHSNVVMGPRGVMRVSASQSVIKGNYCHHNYRGGWSQGFNLDLRQSASLVIEHNFIRGGSWPLQSVSGEFRYNVIYGYGHTWLRSMASGTRVHHNLFAPGNRGRHARPGRLGLWGRDRPVDLQQHLRWRGLERYLRGPDDPDQRRLSGCQPAQQPDHVLSKSGQREPRLGARGR